MCVVIDEPPSPWVVTVVDVDGPVHAYRKDLIATDFPVASVGIDGGADDVDPTGGSQVPAPRTPECKGAFTEECGSVSECKQKKFSRPRPSLFSNSPILHALADLPGQEALYR
jgi:hypothetical protein